MNREIPKTWKFLIPAQQYEFKKKTRGKREEMLSTFYQCNTYIEKKKIEIGTFIYRFTRDCNERKSPKLRNFLQIFNKRIYN